MKINKKQKGFTLIELLMVVALIAILSTVILISLDSGRERAAVSRYTTYATQMHGLIEKAITARQFDRKLGLTDPGTSEFCLGDLNYDCNVSATRFKLIDDPTSDVEAAKIYRALTYLTKMPDTDKDNSLSPYSTSIENIGVYMQYGVVNSDGDRVIRVVMGVMPALETGEDDFVKTVCDKMGTDWKQSDSGNDCWGDVKLPARL